MIEPQPSVRESNIPSLDPPDVGPSPQDDAVHFWAKTYSDTRGQDWPGISVRDHCINVGWVAHALVAGSPPPVRALLPGVKGQGGVVLAALHDIGKITIGFQRKCPNWPLPAVLGERARREALYSVSDHALVSQVFLQDRLNGTKAQLWAAAIGAHHGRPKGRIAKRPEIEAGREWAESWRERVTGQLVELFGPLPTHPPDKTLEPAHTDLWLLAGLTTVADWIGSNEAFFPADRAIPTSEIQQRAQQALAAIGWPGARLVATSFTRAFTGKDDETFRPNSVQEAVSVVAPGLVIIEAPMGYGKTEAALRLAQRWIVAGQHHGLYFALPTQVTSNRIHLRVSSFLHNTLQDPAHLRLAHGNAWLEDDFNLVLRTPHVSLGRDDIDSPFADLKEARSWFASAKHALLSPYGVGTIDQALQSMVIVKHFFVRRFALAGKVIVLDEVHSYDIYTGTLVGALVGELLRLGCSVIILSATLTRRRREELLAAAGCSEGGTPDAYPLITCADRNREVQHLTPEPAPTKSVNLRADDIPEAEVLDELIRRAQQGQHVLWIRNTVIEAQKCFATLRGEISEGEIRLGLLHSRFPFVRRQELEADWLERLGRHRDSSPHGSILIATQVVEQSVDIDLDFIVSDLAPSDMLFQRLGRLWRHDRPLSQRAAQQPVFWLRLPRFNSAGSADELKAVFGRSARVYSPYVLLRTTQAWRDRNLVRISADIRPILEATYNDPGADEPPGCRDLFEELQAEKRTLQANAEAAMRVFGLPMLEPEQDGALTRRKGAPTVPLIVARSLAPQSTKGHWLLTAPDRSTTIISDYQWSLSAARFLHQWMVRVPRWYVPRGATGPNWLAEHVSRDAVLALLDEDGHLRFDDDSSPVSYHPDFGVFADRPAKTQLHPEPWSDDNDEFDS